MSLRINIQETQKQIEKKIKISIINHLNKTFPLAIPKMEVDIGNIIAEAIEDSDEYLSLVAGRLKYEFGIPDAASRMGTVIDVWKGSLRIEFNKFTQLGHGGLTITAIRSDYSDIINLPSAILIEKEYSIPWLRWLLVEGDSVIINDYHVAFGDFSSSRTGGAVMVEDGSWNVPSQYSGVKQNNFVTRSLKEVNKKIQGIIKRELIRNVGK